MTFPFSNRHAFCLTFFMSALLLVSAGCGNNKAAAAGSSCAVVPAGTTVNGSTYNTTTGHCTTETSGKWTALTVHIPTAGGAATLNATCDDVAPFANQAAFDASEGGGSYSSNNDYVVTTSCASGSTKGATTKELFIWKKNP